MTTANHFELLARDGQARTGRLTTPHGVVRTPAFMPVGTAGAMKGLHWREVREAGADIVLGNTYHLMLRPGAERIAALGGLQTFTGWNGPMLTDSGGFQVMSLAQLRKLNERAVTFRSHIDGMAVELSPERSIEVQRLLGSDIAMQLDECVSLPAEHSDIERAMRLSLRWAERSKRAFETAAPGYMLFGIAQGGDVPELRQASARGLVEIGFHGYAIGGLAVGEPQAVMLAMIEEVVPILPQDRPRYLMGGARRRYVRLRDADAQRPSRGGVHAVRPDQPAQRPPRRRSAAARRGKPVAVGARLLARLPASPRQVRRDAGRDAVVGNQRRLLPAHDA
jgi:queuine tRNA-ribosyltransferase